MFLATSSALAQPSFTPCPSPQTGDLCSTSTANVGIGTSTPGFKFTIAHGTELRVFGVDNKSIFVAKNSSNVDESYLWPRWSDDVMYLNYGAAGFNIRNNSSVSTIFMDNSGRVGIGANPADRLTVFGGTSNINIGGNFGSGYNAIWLNGGTASTNYNFLSSAADPTLYINSPVALHFRISNSTRMYMDGNGNLGVGTIDPKGRLDVRAATVLPAIGWGTEQLLSSDALGSDKGGVLNFGGAYTSQGTVTSWAAIAGLKTNATDQDTSGYLAFYTRPGSSAPAERMRIDRDGIVSIGGTTLGSDTSDKLIVNGGIRATAVIGATYQDIAEWVPASEPMPPGTVVVIDDHEVNGVAPSKHAYDTAVAGVISAQPGVLLGIEGTSKAKVATTGRVKVRVDASRGSIHAGDLLVSSDRSGMAMRSEPVEAGGVKMHRPGTLIGKALEPLESGQGEILVLLSLQ
jgi:hypothetical protein